MGWVTRLVSCAWETKEDLLEEGTARTNAQRLERPGTSEVGTPRLHSESKERPETAGGEISVLLPGPMLGMPGVSQALGSGWMPDIHPVSDLAGSEVST